MELKYEVLELLGLGNFGKVYRGRRRGTGFSVAIKVVSKSGREERELTELRKEIGINANLNHPGIILMMETFETMKNFILILEFAHGDLYQVLNEDDGRLPESEVQQIAKQLVSALNYLHSHRVIHRDMKPQNILIMSSGRVKLCDFGFARSMSSGTLMVKSIKGTPLYMAPEVVTERPYNHVADLWSLGVILFELVMGRPPFHADNLLGLIKRIVKEPLVIPVDSEISYPFRELLEGLLNKDPTQRLVWPDLLQHPFVAETKEERSERRKLQRDPERNPKLRMERFLKSSLSTTSRERVDSLLTSPTSSLEVQSPLEVEGISHSTRLDISIFKDLLLPFVPSSLAAVVSNEGEWKAWEQSVCGTGKSGNEEEEETGQDPKPPNKLRKDKKFQHALFTLLAGIVQGIDDLTATGESPVSSPSQIAASEAKQQASSGSGVTLATMLTHITSGLRVVCHLASTPPIPRSTSTGTQPETAVSEEESDLFTNPVLLPMLLEFLPRIRRTLNVDLNLLAVAARTLRLSFREILKIISNPQTSSPLSLLIEPHFVSLATVTLERFAELVTFKHDPALVVPSQALKGITFILGKLGPTHSVTYSALFEVTFRIGLFPTLARCLKPKLFLNSKATPESSEKLARSALHVMALLVHPVSSSGGGGGGGKSLHLGDGKSETESFPLALNRATIHSSAISSSTISFAQLDQGDLERKARFLEDRIRLDELLRGALSSALVSENVLPIVLHFFVQRASANVQDFKGRALRSTILRVLIHTCQASNLIAEEVVVAGDGFVFDELIAIAKLPIRLAASQPSTTDAASATTSTSSTSSTTESVTPPKKEEITSSQIHPDDEYAAALALRCLAVLVSRRCLGLQRSLSCAQLALSLLRSHYQINFDPCTAFPALGLLEVTLRDIHVKLSSSPERVELRQIVEVIKTDSEVLGSIERLLSLDFGQLGTHAPPRLSSGESALNSSPPRSMLPPATNSSSPAIGLSFSEETLANTCTRWFCGVGGSNFGVPVLGLVDSGFTLLQTLASASNFLKLTMTFSSARDDDGNSYKDSKELLVTCSTLPSELRSVMWIPLCRMQSSHLSPSGTISMLNLLRSDLCRELSPATVLLEAPDSKFPKITKLSLLLSLLRESHISRVFIWPRELGGGSFGVTRLLSRILDMISLPFTLNKKDGNLVSGITGVSANATTWGADSHTIRSFHQVLYKHSAVKRLIWSLAFSLDDAHVGVPPNDSSQSSDSTTLNVASGNSDSSKRSTSSSAQIFGAGAKETVLAEKNIKLCLGVIFELVRSSHHFASQFVQGGGIEAMLHRCKFLHAYPAPQLSFNWAYPISVIEGVLRILNQLVRSSNGASFFDHLILVAFRGKEKFWALLLCHSTSSAIRAKTCSLLGTLCKQSPAFYSVMGHPFQIRNLMGDSHHHRRGSGSGSLSSGPWSGAQTNKGGSSTMGSSVSSNSSSLDGIQNFANISSCLEVLILTCLNPETHPDVLQYSTYAIGNAAYYSDELYSILVKGIPALVRLLRQNGVDEKTKANVAGAIGNLVRHSITLLDQLLAAEVHLALVELLRQEEASYESPQLLKMCLFGLCGIASAMNEKGKSFAELKSILSLVTTLANLGSSNSSMIRKATGMSDGGGEETSVDSTLVDNNNGGNEASSTSAPDQAPATHAPITTAMSSSTRVIRTFAAKLVTYIANQP